MISFHVSRHVLSCASPTRLLSKKQGRGCVFSVWRSAAQLAGALARCPAAHLLELRAELRKAAIRPGIFGVESSVNISLCCACSAFIRLLTPRASVFLTLLRWSSLSPASPPTPPPPPRLNLTVLLNHTFTISPSVAPACA